MTASRNQGRVNAVLAEGQSPQYAGTYEKVGNGSLILDRRAALLESYEKQLKHALRWARTTGFLYALGRFLGICVLVWATVVLHSTNLGFHLLLLDSASIACLVVLETTRLVCASFFLRFPSCLSSQARLSQDPRHIDHAQFPATSQSARICLQILQVFLALPSFVIPCVRMICAPEYSHLKIWKLQSSLRIFYSVVVLSSLVALSKLLCSALAYASLSKSKEHSILKYYDRALENAMSLGIAQAADFEFFTFAYTLLASEHRRNVQPEAIAKSYGMLIRYLYGHRLGLDALRIFMDADNAFVKQAAANMVGFWADTVWGVGLKEVTLPKELLSKLADMVGTGQVGWAATSSFGALACRPEGARLLARTCTGSGIRLPDHLANLVDPAGSRSLSVVRTLARFYEHLCAAHEKDMLPKPFGEKAENELVSKLRTLAREAKVQRLRVQAAYLLLMMEEECDPDIITDIDPMRDSYWFQSEVSMLHLLRSRVPYHALPRLQLQGLAIREDTNISPPPWVQPMAALDKSQSGYDVAESCFRGGKKASRENLSRGIVSES